MKTQITVNVTLDTFLIDKLAKSKDWESFCSSMEKCETCPLFFYTECDKPYDDIKKELES